MSFQDEIKELLAKYSQGETENNENNEKKEVEREDQDLASVESEETPESEPEKEETPEVEPEDLEIKGAPEGESEEPASEEPASETPVDFGPAIERVTKTLEDLLARIDRLESARVKAAGGAESKKVEVENQDWLNKLF